MDGFEHCRFTTSIGAPEDIQSGARFQFRLHQISEIFYLKQANSHRLMAQWFP
jgi:hypothetical protein